MNQNARPQVSVHQIVIDQVRQFLQEVEGAQDNNDLAAIRRLLRQSTGLLKVLMLELKIQVEQKDLIHKACLEEAMQRQINQDQ